MSSHQTSARQSHIESLGELVNEYRRPLYRFVLRSVGNPSDAQDIAQQAFLEAYQTISSFRDESELSTWLHGIATTLVRKHLNRPPLRARKHAPGCMLEMPAGDADGPEVLIQRMELMTLMYAQVECLSDDLKQIFLLVALEGASCEEAAQTLSIPIGTVRHRLFRAREAIKAQLPELQDCLQI
jgi:RNA polymerase sigma factor (sigma-70 family)